MRKGEIISLVEYFYHQQARLEAAVRDCGYRYIRRDLDSVDLLEEIIAKERLIEFNRVMADVLRILEICEKVSLDNI
ncbi:MAG: hypothetical protein LUH82_03760 [Clostridiales bacterium]|nr:hypothetical protein [Clostridiales bacterium]